MSRKGQIPQEKQEYLNLISKEKQWFLKRTIETFYRRQYDDQLTFENMPLSQYVFKENATTNLTTSFYVNRNYISQITFRVLHNENSITVNRTFIITIKNRHLM